tara:strand:- start:31 stop:1245 length:1215 start_codon:yes stop_codon:yes gene_type:complete
MAVNLLLLANQLRGNLQNGSSGSRTRSSYQNQPGNLKRGTHIPGTNLKEDQGIRTVARKGRKGDSELRRVGGEVSHVNTTEANAIDTLGPMGEAWVQNIGSGTINPKTGLREYGFGSWLKKRVTPPKKVMAAISKGDWGEAAGGMWDANKGAIAGAALGIATGGSGLLLGALGQAVTSGGTWKPSEGKWGGFGQTKASKERDKAKTDASVRRSQFEDFRRDYENQNIAGIFTEDTEDNTDLTSDYSGSAGFHEMITKKSGFDPSANDIADYTDEYDERKETELADKLERDLKAVNLAGDAINAKSKGVGTGLSSGLFGMLTQSSDTTAAKGFAGSGDFAADFAKKQAVKEAESQFGGIDRDIEGLKLEREGVVADAMSGTQDLQEDYNQEFWEGMTSWDTAINS